MALWNAKGELGFADGLTLRAHMERSELTSALPALTIDETAADPIALLPEQCVEGGALAPVCFFHGTRLHAVELTVTRVGSKRGTAEQQRALLFALACAQDSAPDTLRPVVLRCPFGTAVLSTDPRTGVALLRMTYR